MCPLGLNFSFKWWGRRVNSWNEMRGSGEKLYFNFRQKEWTSFYFLKSERRAVSFLIFLRVEMHIRKVDVTALYTYYCFLSTDHALLKYFVKSEDLCLIWHNFMKVPVFSRASLSARGARGTDDQKQMAQSRARRVKLIWNPFQGPRPALWFSAKQIFPKELRWGLPGCENTNQFSSFALFLPSML